MPTVVTRIESHAQQKEQSYSNLNKSRESASRAADYNYEATRQKLLEECLERCNHHPHPWQLDAAEAFHLGLDCIILAGTGFGKSLPFVMPLMLDTEKILLVISPLNALEEDQTLCKELEELKFRIIYTSPEMVISNHQFNNLLCSANYQKHLAGVVIDEAHCIVQWGGDFRPTYAKVDKLRSFIPTNVPMYITTATMTPDMLSDVSHLLHINPSLSFSLNLGNDRRNISQEIRTIRNGHDFAALDFLFEHAVHACDLERALLFVNRVEDAQLGWQRAQAILPPNLRSFVGFLHSRRSTASKSGELDLFRQGLRRILWVTEVGGMGLDIPDITFVAQLGVPPSLTVWVQCAGRAGRAPDIQARAVLFVEVSALKVIGTAKDTVESGSEMEDNEEKNPDSKTYRKKMEPALRKYVETKGCRRDVVDSLFNNPPRVLVPLSLCCDNCACDSLHRVSGNPSTMMDAGAEGPPTTKQESPAVARRVYHHLQDVRTALLSWRIETLARDFPHSCFTSVVILPDPVLTTIASNRQIRTVADLRNDLSTPWVFAERYGQQVLDLVKRLDEEEQQQKEEKKHADREAKRLESECKQLARALTTEKTRRSRLLQQAKENCVIPGTGCFDILMPKANADTFSKLSPPTLHLPLSTVKPALPMPVLRSPLSPVKSPSSHPHHSTPVINPITFDIYSPQHLPPSSLQKHTYRHVSHEQCGGTSSRKRHRVAT